MKVIKIIILFLCLFLLLNTLNSNSYANSKRISYQVPKNIDLTDIIKGTMEGLEEATIYGELRLPSSLEGKVPAVEIMHASGGVLKFREIEMAKLLNKNGSLLNSATGELFPEKDYPGNHIKPCSTKKVTFGRNNSAAKKYKKNIRSMQLIF